MRRREGKNEKERRKGLEGKEEGIQRKKEGKRKECGEGKREGMNAEKECMDRRRE